MLYYCNIESNDFNVNNAVSQIHLSFGLFCVFSLTHKTICNYIRAHKASVDVLSGLLRC